MSTKPIGIVVEGGTVVGVVNAEGQDVYVIDLDAEEIAYPEEMTEAEYRDYIIGKDLDDRTGDSPFAIDAPQEQA